MRVLYEDNHLLVVEKPVNTPVQADASGDPDLLNTAKAYVKRVYSKPGEVYLGLVHRLDRPVGGVMVFARTSKAAARLSAQFSARQAKKRYVAVVEGEPAASALLEDWLFKDESTNNSYVVQKGTPGAKEARLKYRTLARENGRALLEVELYTGRPHQIRVQLAAAGLPIVGDQRYNPTAKAGTQIRLHAYALTLTHPTTGEEMSFFSLPSWEEFRTQTEFLPARAVCTAVYENDELLIVDKLAGVEVEEGLTAELSALRPTLYPVHRLDANTLGLVVFAKSEEARERLVEEFRQGRVEKYYHAIVQGELKRGARLENYAVKDEERALVRLCPEGTPGSKQMLLEYTPLETADGLSKLEIKLLTGRTHQIRVQLANIGHPVIGDDKYGNRELNRSLKQRRQLLLAKRVSIAGVQAESPRELELKALY